MSPNMYSTIEEKGYDEGIAFIMTDNGGIIEAHLYGGIITFSKSLRLTPDQISLTFSSGDVKEVTFRKADVRLEVAHPATIAQTFPAAVAASAIKPEKTPLPRLFKVMRLMSNLAKSGKEEGTKAADIMFRQIATNYRGFLPDIATFKARIGKLSDEFGISTQFLENKPMPGDIFGAVDWMFSSFETVKDGPIKDVALYFVLFGEVYQKAIKTTVEKETSLGAKPGSGILSKVVYPELKDMHTAQIFKGMEKVGEIKIDWHTDKKSVLLLTKADMDKLGLENGNIVSLFLGV